MPTIEEKALQLKEIERRALRNFSEKQIEELLDNVDNYRVIIDEIKKHILENPILRIDNIEASKIISLISEGKELPLEEAFKDSVIGENFKEKLFFEPELTEIGSDIFYSWFSHYEYIKGLLEIGSLVLTNEETPNDLENFADEARCAYVFQLYHATFSICRTLLEVTMRDLCIKNKILPGDTKKLKRLDNRKTSLANLIDDLCFLEKYSEFYDRLKKIKMKTNFVIHGSKKVTKEEACNVIKETFGLIQTLYLQK